VGSAVWLAFLGANGSGCALTDSVTKSLAPRRDRLTPFDRLTLDLSVARCRNDWQSGYRLALEQSRLRPRSTYAVYTAGFFALTSNHIREAHELLASINPERDLGWLSDPAKTIYWRDFSAAQHLVGEYEVELREAERQVRQFPTSLSSRLTAARALAALGRSREALEQMEAMTRLAPDLTVRVHTGLPPGLACLLLAAELRVHGDNAASRIAAQRAVDWYREDPARVERGRFERYQRVRSRSWTVPTRRSPCSRSARGPIPRNRCTSAFEACWPHGKGAGPPRSRRTPAWVASRQIPHGCRPRRCSARGSRARSAIGRRRSSISSVG
jgi:hypothetical protein